MITCRECGSDDVYVEPALKCKECGKCLTFCECEPEKDANGDIEWEPEYTPTITHVCQICGKVGDVHDSMSLDARSDWEYDGLTQEER